MPAAHSGSMTITLQIVSIVFYTFIAFLCIGLPIAVLPGYVHDQLGFSPLIAGLTIASQYLATLLSRPFAGRATDTLGSKRSIVFGLWGIVISGSMTLLATLLQEFATLSLSILIVARLFLGVSQGLIGVGTISWCIGKLGAEHTARSISWNGIASYGAIAIGAPLGVLVIDTVGFNSLGVALIVMAGLALWLIRNKPSVPVVAGERLPYWSVFGRIAPYGLGLTLSSIGYGTLTTFITLFYLSRGWEGAAYCLSMFGVCFILARLLFIGAINRLGGYNAAIVCMAVEICGLLMLGLSPSSGIALAGAGLTGVGLSLVYPALGVEAIKSVPTPSRGAGLSAYAVFFDLALAIAGPVMGAIALGQGYDWIFFYAALLSVCALALTIWLSRRTANQTYPA
ncbi:MFS transporter [Pseudomonas savastanoi]|nr:MFS transporter [Pseudomonas savastanoi]KPB85905.1 Major facilitator superfamily transporter [Pseudomonas syringae pv. maculicola]EFW80137.1 major facilitator superfamily transporter [Pseudomonas savastanoi pv. glycinea str. B076]KPC25918.1 Major facilitator superfamily transporter [Pseudomonas savastanoi pv. glycinea]KPC35875.1 Major facilitator superfamily transporter [Pseudomonas savastanoi pv. glycinea]KPC44881.1 Major facilitator superfamily transporter [Pseudomonas savastanoi pv. glyc